MTAQRLILSGPGRMLIAGAPEGYDALVLAQLVQELGREAAVDSVRGSRTEKEAT